MENEICEKSKACRLRDYEGLVIEVMEVMEDWLLVIEVILGDMIVEYFNVHLGQSSI